MQTWPQPVRFSSFGKMFRYDRPQAGRYREFWQWNVEAIGDPGPAIDAEVIELGLRWLTQAGAADVQVHLNSIGDANCRPTYLAALADYLARLRRPTAATEKARASISPLRVLDSKDPALAPIIAGAPVITDYLCDACRAHYQGVQAHLARSASSRGRRRAWCAGSTTTRAPRSSSTSRRRGPQSALGGGGRYDGLVELLGGRPRRHWLCHGCRSRRPDRRGRRGVGTASAAPEAFVVGADPAATELRFKVATDLRASRNLCARRPRSAQAHAPAGSRRSRRRALRGGHRR